MHASRRPEQEGIVSLLITMVMMVVISLLVLGFAEVARGEQHSSLNEQLSTQAYYAAESGINDARAVINATVASGAAVPNKTACGPQGIYTASETVDAAHNVSYTCLLVNAAPTTLQYTVGYTSTVVPLISAGPNFGSFTFSWGVGAGYPSTAAGCYTNLANLHDNPVATGTGQWDCNYPMVRVDVYDANGGAARSTWNAKTTTLFFVPFNSGSVNNNVALGAHGTAVPAICTATTCQAHITNVTGTTYYARVTTLYRTNAALSITAGNVPFVGAEAIIDSTGKAQDVLRRVVVAVDLTNANSQHVTSAGLVTEDSVCKRFGITNGSLEVYDDMSAGAGGDVLCTLQTHGTPIP